MAIYKSPHSACGNALQQLLCDVNECSRDSRFARSIDFATCKIFQQYIDNICCWRCLIVLQTLWLLGQTFSLKVIMLMLIALLLPHKELFGKWLTLQAQHNDKP